MMTHLVSWKLVIRGAEGEDDPRSTNLRLLFANDIRSKIHIVTLVTPAGESTNLEVTGRVADLDGVFQGGDVNVEFEGDTPLLVDVQCDGEVAVIPLRAFGVDIQVDNNDLFHSASSHLANERLLEYAVNSKGPRPGPRDPHPTKSDPCPKVAHEFRRSAERERMRARRFFSTLDRLTIVEGSLPHQKRMMRRLGGRILIRTAHGRAGTVPKLSPLRPSLEKVAVETSGFLRTLILSELGKDFGWALDLFATERLVVEHHADTRNCLVNQGVPNGQDFFQLTEFAFLCIENDIQREFWEECLQHLVRASHIYAEHAKNSKGVLGYDPERKRFDLGRIQELRKQYDIKSNSTICKVGKDMTPVMIFEDLQTSILGQTLKSNYEPSGGRPLRCRTKVEQPTFGSHHWIITALDGADRWST